MADTNNNDRDGVRVYAFRDDVYAQRFGLQLLKARREKLYTDVVLRTDDVEIHCHRVVLSAAPSDYFRTMFSSGFEESSSKRVEFQNIRGGLLEKIVDYVYSAEIKITGDNVQNLLQASEMLQFETLKQACESFMLQNMDAGNCIGMYRFSRLYKSENLRKTSRATMMEEFHDVVSGSEFNELNEEELTEYIIDDELRVDNEDQVFEAVLRWVKHEPDSRASHLPYVLHHVRLPFCTPNYLFEVVKGEKLMASADCQKYLDEALSYHLLPERNHESDNPRLKPRRNFPAQQRLVLFGGKTKDQTQIRSNLNCWYLREKTESWEWFSELPRSQLRMFSACVTGRGLLITGGMEGNATQKNCWLFNVVENRWSPSLPMLAARCRHASVAYGDCVYVIGGATCKRLVYSDKELLNTVERFDCRTQRWNQVKPLQAAVVSPMAVSLGRYIFAFGGSISDKHFSTATQVLDTVWQDWGQRAEMPEVCKLGAAVTVKERIFLLGGYTRTCMSYDPGVDQWTKLAEPRDIHGAAPAVMWQGRVLVAGGKVKVGGDKKYTSTIEEYDWERDKWTTWTVSLNEELAEHYLFNVPLFAGANK